MPNLTEFICQTNQANTAEALIEAFLNFLAGYGVEGILAQSNDHLFVQEKSIDALVKYSTEHVNSSKKIADVLLRNLDSEAQYRTKFYKNISLSIYRPFGGMASIELCSSKQDFGCDKSTHSILYAAFNQYLMAYEYLVDTSSSVEMASLLTVREREVLLWLARGKSKSEVSKILNVTQAAIKKHSNSIFRKLEVNNLQLAVAKALKMGLIHPY